MKLIFSILLCFICGLTFAQRDLIIDTKISVLNWTGHAELGSYAPAGTLSFSSGTVRYENKQISSARLVVDMKSMQQSNADLLQHLKSEDFFEVERFPQSIIAIDRVRNGRAYGKLTIKGKTQAFDCPITVSETNGKVGITGNTAIDRTKYGITYNSGSFFSNLGDRAIRNIFEVSFVIMASTGK